MGRAVGRTAGQDCGTGGRPTGYSLYERQYSFRRQPEVTQRDKGVTTLTCFFSSREEGASLSKAHLGLFHIALYIRWDGVNGADPA